MSQTTNNKKVTEPYVIGQDDVNKRDQAKKGEDKRQTRKKKPYKGTQSDRQRNEE